MSRRLVLPIFGTIDGKCIQVVFYMSFGLISDFVCPSFTWEPPLKCPTHAKAPQHKTTSPELSSYDIAQICLSGFGPHCGGQELHWNGPFKQRLLKIWAQAQDYCVMILVSSIFQLLGLYCGCHLIHSLEAGIPSENALQQIACACGLISNPVSSTIRQMKNSWKNGKR